MATARSPNAENPPRFECPDGHDRAWQYAIEDVRYGDGSEVPWQTDTVDDFLQVRIGDPDVTVTGQQTYVLEYSITGALDGYEGHDEFYWDAVSGWPVPVNEALVTVDLPGDPEVQAACFRGQFESEEPCLVGQQQAETDVAYSIDRPLEPGAYMSVVAAWPRGIVDVGPPLTEDRVSIDDFFTLDTLEYAGMGLVAVLGIIGVAGAWWRFGRDRRYTSIYYLTQNPEKETRPLFAQHRVVVEYLPPEDLRPAQMGVIFDERADTVDVTATIIDLGVRGYLSITEIPKEGWFGKTDWELTQEKEPDDALLPYESRLLEYLFQGQADGKVRTSELKEKFSDRLKRVKKELMRDAVQRNWFAGNPEHVKGLWAGIGIGVAIAGGALAFASGWYLDRALIAAPLVVTGLLLAGMSPGMSRRTATGSEAFRRVLGFREYIVTAETHRQEFNEQQNIFARYLPYAIVFKCVDKWAEAFEGMEQLEQNAQHSMGGWYFAAGAFSVAGFASAMEGFSSDVSSSIASTPASSGGSGIGGGGFAGGGGGGGGGGSW
ncbi:MAG: DUF2207 domain-containing protein [Dehalococcoidia bacterium]|nr:DUF2207 domain-containing protein [Dehalococcoidia bacterium]